MEVFNIQYKRLVFKSKLKHKRTCIILNTNAILTKYIAIADTKFDRQKQSMYETLTCKTLINWLYIISYYSKREGIAKCIISVNDNHATCFRSSVSQFIDFEK